MLTAAYGLVNASAKFQVQPDKVLIKLGFVPAAPVAQLSLFRRDNSLTAMLAKIVDDMLLSGHSSTTDPLVEAISTPFSLGTVVHGPGKIRYFGLNTLQHEVVSIVINGNDKLHALEDMPISRSRRKEYVLKLNSVEERSFSPINYSIG